MVRVQGVEKHSLTSFGKVVYVTQVLIGKAKDNLWKLRAIDSFESSDRGMAAEEPIKIVEKLIVDDDLNKILLGRKQTNLVEKRP